MLAPEGFLQFVQPFGMAETQIREIALIKLSQQTPRPGAFHCLPQAM
jgi:hypothetical protein